MIENALTAENLLAQFITETEKRSPLACVNTWLEDGTLYVYVRRSQRFYNRPDGLKLRLFTLDIASVEALRTGKGRFTQFLQRAEELNPWPAIFVENVQTERFANFFRKRGWAEISIGCVPSFFKIKAELKLDCRYEIAIIRA